MIVEALAFYLFAGIAIASGVMVIASRNAVHSVLFLILAFFNAAGLFVLLGAEFLAFILIVVYVGAVAVLFMFVVMMLDINFAALRQGFLRYLPLGGLVGAILAIELLAIVGAWAFAPERTAALPTPDPSGVPNTEALGAVLYTHYLYLFQASGIVLLVAMVGAIVLTHRKREGVRRQRIAEQVGRDAHTAVELRKVQPGRGI